MALFPIVDNRVQLNTDAVEAIDAFRNGVRLLADDSACRASDSGFAQFSNGLPMTSLGQVVFVDATAGLPSGTQYVNGIPVSPLGAICISIDVAVTYSNGLPFAANGALAAVSGAPWTPAALGSALALWLDADDASTITLNGSTVSQWNDKSGNGRNASQATAANQPTRTLAGLGGRTVLTFDGVDDRLVTASTTLGITNSASLIVLAQLSSRTPPEQGIVGSDEETNRFGFFISGSNAMRWNPMSTNQIEAPSVTGTQILVGTAQSGATELFRNGTSIVAGAGSAGSMVSTPFSIGNMRPGTTLPHFSGPIAEVLVLSSSLSTTNRQLLEGYLAWKWGLEANLPSDHPFKNTPPTV